MVCKGCGLEITSEHQFCPSCGMKNEMAGAVKNSKRCMDCGKEFPEERFFCDACGGKLAPIAPAPAGGSAPTQGFPGQAWNAGPMEPNRMPPPMPSNMPPNMPPPIPPYIPSQTKKKSKAVPIIIAVVAVVFLLGGVIFAYRIYQAVSTLEPDYNSDIVDDTGYDTTNDSTDVVDPYTDSSTDSSTDSDSSSEEDATTNFDYNIVYSYSELPEVISIDADYRFSYANYYSEDGIATYSYMYNDIGATVSDFYSAIDSYCVLVQNLNGFIYEKEFSETQYQETGDVTTYMTKDDICLAVSVTTDDGFYAYVSIFSLSEEEASAEDVYFENYMGYIAGRDSKYFDLSTEVSMENGVAFYLYDISATDLGDGTQALDVNIDLASYYTDCYLYPDDFMIVPMDAEGNVLSDAVMASAITNSEGYEVTTPFLLDTEYYYNYKMRFLVPAETKNFTVYGTNVMNEDYAGPVYYIDMEIDEY